MSARLIILNNWYHKTLGFFFAWLIAGKSLTFKVTPQCTFSHCKSNIKEVHHTGSSLVGTSDMRGESRRDSPWKPGVCFCTFWGLMNESCFNKVSGKMPHQGRQEDPWDHEGVPRQGADPFSTKVFFRVSDKNPFLLSQAAVTDTPLPRWSLLCYVAAKSKFPLQMLPLQLLPVCVMV